MPPQYIDSKIAVCNAQLYQVWKYGQKISLVENSKSCIVLTDGQFDVNNPLSLVPVIMSLFRVWRTLHLLSNLEK